MPTDLAKQRTRSEAIELHPFALAYVVSLAGAPTVVGLPDAVLLPKEPKLREKALAEGEKRLVADGLITPGASPGVADYDQQLLSAAAAIADPRMSVIARRHDPRGHRSDALIYLNNVDVVELVQTGRQQFRLRALRDAMAALKSLRKSAAVTPRHRYADARAELHIAAFERARAMAGEGDTPGAAVELVEAGLAPDAAGDLAETLKAPMHRGSISLLKHVGGRVVDVRVLGFHVGDEGAWVVTVVNEGTQQVGVEAVGAEAFVRRLVERIANLGAAVVDPAETLAPVS